MQLAAHAPEVPVQAYPPQAAGLVVAGSAVHAPFAVAPFAALHVSQAPLQPELQQKPSRQEPLVHCRSRAQAAPLESVAVQVVVLQ